MERKKYEIKYCGSQISNKKVPKKTSNDEEDENEEREKGYLSGDENLPKSELEYLMKRRRMLENPDDNEEDNVVPEYTRKKGIYKSYNQKYESESEEESDDELAEWKEPETLEEKRKLYKCGKDFVTLKDIPKWNDYAAKEELPVPRPQNYKFKPSPKMNDKISMFYGDITTLEIDCIVNAANGSLRGGGGIDGAIHSAAGYHLCSECRRLYPRGCNTGDARITRGFKLPAKTIIHTVGPYNEEEDLLEKCYVNTLDLVLKCNIKTVAFCCVATGIYGFPLKKATHIALRVTRKWLEKNHENIDRIIFCVFLPHEKKVYERYIPWYFPRILDVSGKTKYTAQEDEEPETPSYFGKFVMNWPTDNDVDDDVSSLVVEYDGDIGSDDEKKFDNSLQEEYDNVEIEEEEEEEFHKKNKN